MRKVVLSELCSIQSGGTPSRGNEAYWAGSIPWAKISDLEAAGDGYIKDTEEHITEEGLKAIRGRLFDNGTLLFAMYGSVGKTAIVKGEVSTNQAILGIKPITKQLDLGYLRYWLRSQQYIFDRDAKGVTQKNLSAGYVRGLKIPLPPLSEQKRIATILDKANAIRRKRQQATQLAEEFLRAVFLDMFGDPVTNPKGWKVKKIDDLCEVQGGLQVSKKRSELSISAPYLRVANVLRNRLYLGEIKEINLTQAEYDRVRLKRDDVLIVEGHGNPNEIGRSALWTGEIDGMVHQNHLIRVRVKSKEIRPRFVNDYINSPGGRVQMMKASNTTSGLNTISTGIVKSTEIIVPPIYLQDKYMSVVSKFEDVLVKSRMHEGGIDSSLFSLIKKAFKGNL